jgi:glycosyltransferase involved in cell wall biosynthesis
MGKPTIVTATTGQSDVIEDGVTGMTVPPGDHRRLAEAIRFLLDSPRERHRMGRNAREAFDAQFTLESYCAALLNQMQLIAGGPSTDPTFIASRRVTT